MLQSNKNKGEVMQNKHLINKTHSIITKTLSSLACIGLLGICINFVACDSKEESSRQNSNQILELNKQSPVIQSNDIGHTSTSTTIVIPADAKSYLQRYKDYISKSQQNPTKSKTTLSPSNQTSSQSNIESSSKDSPTQNTIDSTNANISNQQAQKLDEEFVMLRKKYINSKSIMSYLSQAQCIVPDCSALIHNNTYSYPNTDIIAAYQSIVMDKNTKIFSDLALIQVYDYLLKTKETTTIDLQSQETLQNSLKSPYKTLQFAWESPNKLTITLTPKEEICLPYQYNSITTFIQDNNGVSTSRYSEKLPVFSYPQDLVSFVAQSCSCARALGAIPSIDTTSLDEASKKSFVQPDKQSCNDLDSKRKDLWEKYTQDSRIISILQHEQKMYSTQSQENLSPKATQDTPQ